ncbi:hypothetical protein POSPLADRAFT_1131844 [Postia placenta MAD-698-R-SB12]|uniref:Uncharacterized protein n=1 Tax=Postia placenta MAD-698-R-SB12 TaxID=670580 RepID=A0A1X6NCU3_9APHY|nr:hypothetical protein POSPLADRAFT_1131844 [Postia placenta MAD-698-R-SB12]OSX66312.1 hypothetical protein POSPLADRAFT_1131844 [Postia placenta MAD-698-R-SB12]
MIHWQDPDVVLLVAFIFSQMLVYTLGLYGWQLLRTFHYVEWPLLTRKMNFKLVYNSRWALWTHKHWVQYTLLVLCIAHIIICFIVGVMNVKPTVDNDTLCGAVTSNSHHEVAIFVAYTIFFDFVILCSTLFGLRSKPRLGNKRLWAIIHRQGILYLVMTVVVNVPSLVFAHAALNPIMDVFFTIPAFISLMSLKEDNFGERQEERQELTDMSSTGKRNGQFTTNVEITPSLFLNSGNIPMSMLRDFFDESLQSTSQFIEDGEYNSHYGPPSRPPGDLGPPPADHEMRSDDITNNIRQQSWIPQEFDIVNISYWE